MASYSVPGGLQGAADEAQNACKRQRTTELGVDACMDRLIDAAKAAREALGHGQSASAVILQLQSQLEEAYKEANRQTKDLHTAVSKLSKVF